MPMQGKAEKNLLSCSLQLLQIQAVWLSFAALPRTTSTKRSEMALLNRNLQMPTTHSPVIIYAWINSSDRLAVTLMTVLIQQPPKHQLSAKNSASAKHQNSAFSPDSSWQKEYPNGRRQRPIWRSTSSRSLCRPSSRASSSSTVIGRTPFTLRTLSKKYRLTSTENGTPSLFSSVQLYNTVKSKDVETKEKSAGVITNVM